MSGELFKILAICLVAALLCIVLKPCNGEYAFGVSVIAGIVITYLLLKIISAPIETIRLKLQSFGVETQYFKVALKSVGIGYITNFIADACRDGGQVSMASKAEFAGKCAIFILCCPLMISVLETAVGFIK
jgi:stage III sporulation protein AD